MYTVVLDTNMILDAIEFRVNIFEELDRICEFQYDVAILDKTIDELKNKKNSKLALKIIENKKVNILKTEQGYVDDLLLKLDDKKIIATNDQELKRKLKKLNRKIITLRQKKYLITENVL